MIRGPRSDWAHVAEDEPRRRPGWAPLVVLGAAMALLMALGTFAEKPCLMRLGLRVDSKGQ